MAKKLARRIKKLEEQIEELQRLEGLPGDKVEPWASLFASADGVEVGEEHLEAARAFVAYCLARKQLHGFACLNGQTALMKMRSNKGVMQWPGAVSVTILTGERLIKPL